LRLCDNRPSCPLAYARGSFSPRTHAAYSSTWVHEPRPSGSGHLAWKSALLGLLLALSGFAATLDRLAVSVGKDVITENDVLRAVRVAAFLDQKPLDTRGDVKRKAAERLVDQLLLLREAMQNRAVLPGPEEGAKLLEQSKTEFSSPEAYREALKKYEVTEQEVENHLLTGFQTLQYTDQRFRPEVQVSEDDLREFYQFISAGFRRDANNRIPSFEDSREQVRQLLVEQRVMQALEAWLSTARTQVGVMYRERVFE
jgi:hypothetical protein